MATPAQLAANRLNAQKSTGPSSPAGKEITSQNALKHGLTSRSVLLPEEDPAEFDALRSELLDELHPQGPLELFYFDRIFTAAWRLRRAHLVELGLFGQRPDSRHDDDHITRCSYPTLVRRRFEYAVSCSDSLGKLSRYENALLRGQQQALKQLLALQSTRHSDPHHRPEHKNLRNEPNSAPTQAPTTTSEQHPSPLNPPGLST